VRLKQRSFGGVLSTMRQPIFSTATSK